jgi:hypothetical protein
MTSEPATARTYGGWRRRRPMGLLGLGPGGTLALFGVVIVVLASVAVSPRAALYIAPPLLAGAALSLAHVQGMPLAVWVTIRIRWWRAVSRNWTSYRAGIVVEHPRAWQLPGVLAATMLVSAEDGRGGRYGLVWDRHTGFLTATIGVTPASWWLADRADADTWVASWGGWLASLGHIPAVRWVTVTVETAPEHGTTLADTVAAEISPDAPEAARQIITAVAAASPDAAAHTTIHVSITYDPRADPARPGDLTAAAAAVTRSLHGLMTALSTCGVTVDGLATAADLAAAVRVAYDPASRGEVARLMAAEGSGRAAESLTWLDAGPVGAHELADAYLHDSGISITWAWHEAPRQNVTSTVLARLTGPGPWPKRVTLQYRPFSAAAATRAIEQEVNAAGFRAAYKSRTGRDATARDNYDHSRAAQAAMEEAAGAGVGLMGLYVTVTATDADHLPQAAASVEAAAEGCRIRLRRMYHSQAAGFATTLPCGICPPALSGRRSR